MTTRPMAILTDSNGMPSTIGIATRPSESAPGRMKVALCIDLDDTHALDHEGTLHSIKGEGTTALCPEFRLEMN